MLSCIVAVAKNNAIGKNNKMLWYIKEDLQYFKEITMNHTIIMGRKTFESLPGILPNRKHIVITRNKDFNVDNENVEIINNIDEIVDKYKNSLDEAFIIGGGDIYKKTLPMCSKLYLTRVNKDFNGDVFFPEVDLNKFKLISKSTTKKDIKSQLDFTFEVYQLT